MENNKQLEHKKSLTDLINDPNVFVQGELKDVTNVVGVDRNGFARHAQSGVRRLEIVLLPVLPDQEQA